MNYFCMKLDLLEEWFGVTGATDIWQPVNTGFDQMLKSKINEQQKKSLKKKENTLIFG